MYPHERTCRFPGFHGVALHKPRGRAMMMRFPGDVVVYPWIWGGQPTANLFLQLVTYNPVSAYIFSIVTELHHRLVKKKGGWSTPALLTEVKLEPFLA